MSNRKMFEELCKLYLKRYIPPYGEVLIVPNNNFKPEWSEQLKVEGVKIFANSYEGQACFFLKPPEPAKMEIDIQILNLKNEGYSPKEIAEKLDLSLGKVLSVLRKHKPKHKPENQAKSRFEPDSLKQFLDALNLLYQNGHEQICLFLLKHSSNFLNSR